MSANDPQPPARKRATGRSLGWSEADMPPVGTRDCLSRCLCVLEFRKSEEAA